MRSVEPEELARLFHQIYEHLAPNFGYKTGEESAKPWADAPEQYKELMIAVCRQIKNLFDITPLTAMAGYFAPLKMVYRNHKDETSVRTVLPQRLEYKSTTWHPETQWILEAYDNDKRAWRSFAVKNIIAMEPAPEGPKLDLLREFIDDLRMVAKCGEHNDYGLNECLDKYKSKIRGTKAKLTLFKNWGGYGGLGGKYAEEQEIELTEEEKKSIYMVWDRVYTLMAEGKFRDYHVLITCPGHVHDHPRLIVNMAQSDPPKTYSESRQR